MTKIKIDLTKPGSRDVNVTPALAAEWLELNVKNRTEKKGRIPQYVRDMQEGNWRYTGEPIKFNKVGHLADGQNRLQAIILSGTTQRFLVVTGLEEDAQEVMDTGSSRTVGDALSFLGYAYPNEIATTARVHYMWKDQDLFRHCMFSPSPDRRPTNAEVLQYLERHPGLAEVSVDTKPISRQLHLPHGAISAARYEFEKIDAEYSELFFDKIMKLSTEGQGDPIYTLLRRADKMKLNREAVKPATALYLMIRTWNAFRGGEEFRSFTFGSESGGWSFMPEPK